MAYSNSNTPSVYFSCFAVLASTTHTMLNRSGDMGQAFLFSSFYYLYIFILLAIVPNLLKGLHLLSCSIH